jgi:hypothetical protein
MRRCLALGLMLLAVMLLPAARAGLDGESNTDGYNPAAEADEQGEARRQAIIARQIELVDRLNWPAIYCQFCDPLDPWPPISGDLGGYPHDERARQPIGHESGPTGPNRWNYRPLYADDVEVVPAPRAEPAGSAPEEIGPHLPAPLDAQPGDFVPPANRKRSRQAFPGPREF